MPKYIKHIFFTIGMFFLTPLGCVGASETLILEPFKSKYDLKGFGILEVERTVTLSHQGTDLYTLRAVNKASGFAALAGYGPIIEESRFIMSSGHIRPLTYKNIDESGLTGLDDLITFDWEKQIAKSKRKGLTFSMPITSGTLDPLTIGLRVRLDLKAGLTPSAYQVHETEVIRIYKISYLPSEKISLPNVELDGIHLVIDAGRINRKLHYWLAPALDYLPIQMHQSYKDKIEVRATLISTSLLP